MTSKMTEAILVVLDVGKSVGTEICANGATFFENAKLCAAMIVQRKIFSSTKVEVGLVLIGSENTNNPLNDGVGYQNIEVAHSLQLANWNVVRTIASCKSPTSVDGDWLDGLVVAMDYLKSSTEGKVYDEIKIVLLTNFRSNVCDDEVESVIRAIKRLNIGIVVIGPHMYNQVEEQSTKSNDQLEGEKLIATIVDEIHGDLCDFEAAIPQLVCFERRKQRSSPWRAVLNIGSELKVPVVGYLKISDVKRVQAKNVVLPSSREAAHASAHPVTVGLDSLPSEEENSFTQPDDSVVSVQRDFVYTTVSETPAPVNEKDVIEGYMFGTTIIPVSDDVKQGISYIPGDKCFSVLGFTHASNVPRRYFGGKGCLFFFSEKDENTMRAFSALVQAMHSKEMVAIVRKIYRKGACPQIGALFPEIHETYQCLIYIQLPFSQDVRSLLFPPLVKDPGTPSQDQLKAVDQLIEAMNLMAVDEYDCGELCEVNCPETSLDPTEQHYNHFVASKILKGDTVIKASDALESVQSMLIPKKAISDKAAPVLACIEELFPLKEMKQKEGTRRAAADEFKSDVKSENQDQDNVKPNTASVESSKELLKSKIGTLNPQIDFLNLIAHGSPFANVCHMMQSVITAMVDNAVDEDEFNKPFKALITLRKECVSKDPSLYNDWIVQLKTTWLKEKSIFWDNIIKDNLGLISTQESNKSAISSQEADDFLRVEETKEDDLPSEPMDEDLDDLIDQMM